MKKKVLKIFVFVLLFSLLASPVLAQVNDKQTAREVPEGWEKPNRPEPELLPQEILDEFEGGMTIEEFLSKHKGPIPHAMLDLTDYPVDVIVRLDKPSLIEHVKADGLSRDDQKDYVEELEEVQEAILDEIMAGRAEIKYIYGFTKVLNGFMLQVPAKAINEIRALPGVKSVRQARQYEPTVGASIPLINADDVWAYNGGYTGKGVTIAVIDTGIDYNHAMLGGSGDPDDYANNDPDIIEDGSFPTAKVIGGYDFAGSNYDAGGKTGSPVPVPDPDPLDQHGHGTHVSSTAAGVDAGFGSGVAPDALLYALKVFGQSGSTSLVVPAIEWAMDPNGLGHLGEPVDVINMSLGSDWGPADPDDPEYIAVENAVSIGVVVAASAGNSGDSSYIVGSPSTGDSAISVAASTTGFQTSPYLTYSGGEIPYTTSSNNPFTTTITADLARIDGFNPSEELCNISGLVGDELDGKIALIKRGSCSFYEKVDNAAALGAVAAIIYNNAAGTISMNTDDSVSLLPSGSILQSDGNLLKGLAPVEITIGPDSKVKTFPSSDPVDTIASFSSRGPRGFDSKLKPEITAPGVAIFAAEVGGGDAGVSMSGTSMAAPHIAGVAALIKEAHPGWDPVHVKAAMMNTAVDLANAASQQIPRQGAGRVDALKSVATQVVAYADLKLVSLPWGLIEIDEDYSDTQTITLRNDSDEALTFNIGANFTSMSGGATLTPATTTITVPAHGVASVDVTLDLDASELPVDFGDLEEYYGFITFTSDAETLRIPFYFVPRPYTTLIEEEVNNRFEINDIGWVDFSHEGPVESDLYAFPVSLVSEEDPDMFPAADLRYVGMDWGGSSPYGDIIMPGFAMWGGVHTNQPYFSEVNMYIYSPYGNVVNLNYNYGALSGGDGDNNWVVVQVDLDTNNVDLGSPYFIYADFNSGFQEWYLPASWHWVDDEFEYEVASFDWGDAMDYAGYASWDIMTDPFFWLLTDDAPFHTEESLLFMINDWYAFKIHDVQGIMLVDYNGKPGAGQSYFWNLDPYFAYFYPTIKR